MRTVNDDLVNCVAAVAAAEMLANFSFSIVVHCCEFFVIFNKNLLYFEEDLKAHVVEK